MPTKLKQKIVLELETVEDAVNLANKLYIHTESAQKLHQGRFYTCDTDLHGTLCAKLLKIGVKPGEWQPPKPLRIGDYEVKEVNPDGSVQVGCTRVDRATLEAIYKASTEAMTQAEPEWPKYFMGMDSDVVMQADSPEDLGTFHCSDGRTWKSTCNPPAVRHAKGEGRKQLTKAEAEKIVGRKL